MSSAMYAVHYIQYQKSGLINDTIFSVKWQPQHKNRYFSRSTIITVIFYYTEFKIPSYLKKITVFRL